MILYPVFQTPHSGNPQALCASNEKQIGMALRMYVEDFDERFPGGARMVLQPDRVVEDTPR